MAGDMICEKTGANVLLDELGCIVRGDVYTIGEGHILIRVNNRSRQNRWPTGTPIHYTASRIERWFDDDESPHGTIIVSVFRNHGYYGDAL